MFLNILSTPALNFSSVFLKIREISYNNNKAIEKRNRIFSEKHLRDECHLNSVSSLIKTFLAKVDFSSVLLKLSLLVFPKCFLILPDASLRYTFILVSYKIRALQHRPVFNRRKKSVSRPNSSIL